MKTKICAFLLAVWMVLALGGCGGKDAGEEPPVPPDSQEPPLPSPPPEPEPYVPAGTNPLTGLPMEPEDEEKRPIAVVLNNLKAAQPQLGISQADIIYEVPVEGGITRMLGVYQSVEGIERLGSVRSARPYFVELALGHDAVFVHAGGSQEAYSNLRSWRVDHMDGVRGGEDAKIFWRDPDRKRNNGYEHSLVTSGKNILDYLAGASFPTEHDSDWNCLQLFTEDPAQGEPARQVTLRFSNYKTAVFDYDDAGGCYRVSQYGKEHLDGSTGQQVQTVNLLVLETSIGVISGDTEGRLRVKTTGEGTGTYFRQGKAIPIQWSRNDRNSPFVYRTAEGEPLALGQGNSYVCIITPRVSTLQYE